jgi:hypothetical protein
MKSFFKIAATITILAAVVALCAPGPGASNEHFVVTNENIFDGNNTAAILKLGGTRQSPTLPVLKTLQTGIMTHPNFTATPNVQIGRYGADLCIFVGDSQTSGNEISSFLYPGFTLVGNYSDPEVPNNDGGAAVVVDGNFLLAGYGDGNTYLGYIGVWKVGPECTLTLLETYNTFIFFDSLAVTPDGRTLLVSYFDRPSVDSFSIGSDGSLTEHGPYGSDGFEAGGVDITADSMYALFQVDTSNYPKPYLEIEVYPINTDGSLGPPRISGIGQGSNLPPGDYLRLSPDERFVFADSDTQKHIQIVTLQYEENPFELKYAGCLTKLKGGEFPGLGQIETAASSGSGGGLYVPEWGNIYGDEIALLAINSATGCTTEVKGSPYTVDTADGRLVSLAVWPPRPF